jgi:hypothetical protein
MTHERKRELLEGIAELLADALGSGHEAGAEYYDQKSSPLPSATFLRLVRRGEVVGYKVHGRVLVRRDVLHAYIEQHAVKPRKAPAASPDNTEADVDAEVDRLLGFRNLRRTG